MVNHGAGSITNLRKKVTKTHELITTSYHEAGHTIYGLLKFMKIGSVSIYHSNKSGIGEGYTNYESIINDDISDPNLLNYLIKCEIGLDYSGLCAEKFYFKSICGSDKFPIFLRGGSSDDTLSAAALIRKYNLAPPGRKRYAFKQKMIKDTINLLNKYWSDVIIVSHELFKRRRLYYSDLKNILIKKSENKSFWKEQFKNIDYLSENLGSLDDKAIRFIVLP